MPDTPTPAASAGPDPDAESTQEARDYLARQRAVSVEPDFEAPDLARAEAFALRVEFGEGKKANNFPELANLARAYLDRDDGVKVLAEEVARRAMVESQLRKELESLRAVPAGEPVAWQYRICWDDGSAGKWETCDTRDERDTRAAPRQGRSFTVETRDLFASLPASAEDAKRLDWLTEQLVPEGFGWKAYHSRTERGYRLSTTRQTPNYATPREALDAARAASQSGSDR